MTSFLVNVMDDGDNPTEEVLYIKRIFEDSLRDNGSYEQIRNHLDKELGIEKKNTFGSIAKNLSLGRSNVYIYLTQVGHHYSLIVTPPNIFKRVGPVNGEKTKMIKLFAKCIPLKNPATLFTTSAARIADILTSVGKKDCVYKLDVPDKIIEVVRQYL